MYYLYYEYKNVAKKVSPLLIELYSKICPIFGVQFIVRELTSLDFVYIIWALFFFFLFYNRFFIGYKDFIDTSMVHIDDFKGIAVPFCLVEFFWDTTEEDV